MLPPGSGEPHQPCGLHVVSMFKRKVEQPGRRGREIDDITMISKKNTFSGRS